MAELEVGRGVAALVGPDQVALFRLPADGRVAGADGRSDSQRDTPDPRLRAIDNRDPASGANVLCRGVIGSTGDVDYVASPLYKQRFDLATGRCLDGETPPVRVWPVRVWGGAVEVLAASEDPAAGSAPAGSRSGRAVLTHCPFCALQCGMGLVADEPAGPGGPRRIEVKAWREFPVNEGRMCIKGWSSADLLDHPDRILYPQVRDQTGRLRRASWEAALDELAARLTALRERHGPEAIGVFGSGALTNEKAYLLGKFARVALRTPNIDYNGRYCMSSAAAAQNRSFGVDRGLPFPLADVARTGTLVLWGSNPADTMPPFMRYVDMLRQRGGRLVVVDPRRTATAAIADLHLQPVPGSDLGLALGLLHEVIAGGSVDEEYVAQRTTGWEEARASAADWNPDRVRSVTGVAPDDLAALVRALSSGPAMMLTGRGPEQQTKGVDTVTAIINVMLALGHVGRPWSGYGCLTGQGNGQGGREHGQKADQLPGYRMIADPADRAAVAAAWGIDVAALPGPGASATEMITGIGTAGGVHGLIVAGSNLAVAAPDGSAVRERLSQLDLLAVLDAFPSDTTAAADVVLPVSQWAEEDGTMTNLEGRVIRRRRAVAPPGEARSDLEVLVALAERLGAGEWFRSAQPADVFEEMARVSAGGRADYSGMSYARLDAGPGLYWPCPSEDHLGTPRLFEEGFAHAGGKARFVGVAYRSAHEEPDGDYPIRFTTGRYREHYNSGNQTRRLGRLVGARPEPVLSIHPELAARLGVGPAASVVVESRRGSATYRVGVDDGIRPDTVFAPFHWGGAQSANQLTAAAVDPISRMPEFKVSAVRIRPAL